MDAKVEEGQTSDGEYDLHDDEDEYPHIFQSIRSPTGLELGVRVTWPNVEPLELTTCLPSDEIAPMFHGTQWAGTRVWKAAIVALQYLLNESSGAEGSPLQHQIIRGKSTSSSFSCLELGCGLGVPSMILQRVFPRSYIVLTDCSALVPQLSQNVTQNFASSGTPTPKVAALDWEKEEDLSQILSDCRLSAFDVALNCDCIYEPLYGESWKALLKVQMALLKRNPHALILTSLERRKFDGADRYLQALQQEQEHQPHPVVSKVELVHEDDPVQIYRIFGRLDESETVRE